jgi:hypothetical protein
MHAVIESVFSLLIPAIELRRFYRCSCTVHNNNNIHYSITKIIIIIEIIVDSVDFISQGRGSAGFGTSKSSEPWLIDCK